MKKIRNIIMIALAGVTAQGCSLLDIRPDGRTTLEEIFSDHYNTAAYLNTCYQYIPAKGFSYYWVCNALTGLSDEGYLVYEDGADGIAAKMCQGSGVSASSHPIRANQGNDYYGLYMLQLRNCNTFLQYIDNANVNTEAERNRWRAEAHVLKAYYMSEMMKWFGAFAYEPDGYPLDYDYSNLEKRTVWELARLIDEECTKGLEAAELPWRIESSGEKTRVTKAVAWCLKSKMYLFAASAVHTEDHTAAEKAQQWATAFQVNRDAVAALEANGYALKTTVTNASVYTGKAAAYQELFNSTSLTTANDPETIWQGTGYLSALAHNYIGSNTWLNATRAGIVPTQEMVDAYEVLSPDGMTAVPLLDLSNPYNPDKTPNYNPDALGSGFNFDPDDPYAAPRDPRMAVCIIKNGDQVSWNGEMETVETYVGGDNGISSNPTETRFTRTGYYFRKYVAPNADPVNGIASAPWKYFRLGEIKLNLAEAAAEAAAAGVTEGNPLDVAYAQVNAVRARVGMPALPAGLSAKEMVLRVRQERMVELVYEECRYFDVRRWGESYESSSLYKDFQLRCANLTGMWITKNPDDSFTYERMTILTNKSTRPRDLLLPIPQTEADMLYTLTGKRWQNSGW